MDSPTYKYSGSVCAGLSPKLSTKALLFANRDIRWGWKRTSVTLIHPINSLKTFLFRRVSRDIWVVGNKHDSKLYGGLRHEIGLHRLFAEADDVSCRTGARIDSVVTCCDGHLQRFLHLRSHGRRYIYVV